MTSVGFSPSLHVSHASIRPNRRTTTSGGSSGAAGLVMGTAAGEQQLEAMVRANLAQYAAQRLTLMGGSLTKDAHADQHQTNEASAEQRRREWRAAQQQKTKTLHFLLFLCLNGGSDPPDHARIEPCAKLQCWCDPTVAQAKLLLQSSEAIGEALEAQYKGVQKEGVYKRALESSLDEARTVMLQMRRKAKDGRMLVHYNGHGMPRATSQGEIWLFDKEHTHYHPLGIKEIVSYCGGPTLYVLDCNGAGGVLNGWKQLLGGDVATSRDMFLCACSDGEYLPSNPRLPADVLTSCLTTPVKTALEWYIHYSYRQMLLPDVTPEMIRNMPGEVSNRKSLLGEINWILTAVTESIAWATLSRSTFYTAFRTDPIVVKALFRNFLLADRLLREMGVTPVSHPPLPPDTHLHEMWGSWEVALEGILCQLPSLLDSNHHLKPGVEYTPSTFFADQLTAFEVWLEVGNTAEHPLQLPCLVLGLVQTSYRVRALTLLCRYLSMQHREFAVTNVLYCGATPYLSKLLNYSDVSLLLIVAWMYILKCDEDFACNELIRHQAERPLLKLISVIPGTALSVNAEEFNHTTAEGVCSPPANLAAAAAASTSAAGSTATAAGGGNIASSPIGAMGGSSTGGGTSMASPSHAADHHADPTTNTASASTTAAAGSTPSPAAATTGTTNNGGDAPQRYYVLNGVTIERGRAVAAYLLTILMHHGGERLQTWCWNNNLLAATFSMLGASSTSGTGGSLEDSYGTPSLLGASGGASSSIGSSLGGTTSSSPGAGGANGAQIDSDDDRVIKTWGCIMQATLLGSLTGAKKLASSAFFGKRFVFDALLQDQNPPVRAAACHLLGHYLGWRLDTLSDDSSILKRIDIDRRIFKMLAGCHHDPSVEVRLEILVAACQLIYWYAPQVAVDTSEEAVRARAFEAFKTPMDDRGVQSHLKAGPLDLDADTDAKPAYLTRNEPHAPPSSPLTKPLSDTAKEYLHVLVEDSLALVGRYLTNVDKRLNTKAAQCIADIRNGDCPRSDLLKKEAARSMAGIGTLSADALLKEDKPRARRNADLMRQLILANANRAAFTAAPTTTGSAAASASGVGVSVGSFGPTGGPPISPASPITPGDFSSPVSVGGGGGAVAGGGDKKGGTSILSTGGTSGGNSDHQSSLLPKWSIHGLPITLQEQAVAAQFRLLEPHVLHADRTGRVLLSSIQSMERIALLDHFTHSSAVQQLHIVNDIEETPIALVSDVLGGFALYPLLQHHDTHHYHHHPDVAAAPPTPLLSFNYTSALPASIAPSPPRPIRVVSEYRPRDATLLFSASNQKLCQVSLVAEKVLDALNVHGENVITALSAEKGSTNPRVVYAGMSDGTVRLFDDRSGDGKLAPVSALEDHSGSTARRAQAMDPAIIAVGTTATQATQIFAATSSVCKLFDLRNTKKGALRTFDLMKSSGAGPAGGPSVAATGMRGMHPVVAAAGQDAADQRVAAACCISPSLPLISSIGTDGTIEVTTLKGESVLGLPRPRTQAINANAVCVTHPSKPLLLSGTEIIALH